MRLFLIRHAVTAETGTKLTGRLPGVPLSPAGHQMAADLADQLAGRRVDALYTSPILRCKQTAAPLAKIWNLTAAINSGFIEADFGDWSGRSLASLRRLKAWQGLFVAPSRFRFPGGESLGEVQARAVSGAERLADRHPKQTVAVVSHSDVIRALVAHYIGTPLDLFQRIEVSPASVTMIDLPPGGFPRVPVVNAVLDVARWR
jgi:probable phosphoglycerate mutase